VAACLYKGGVDTYRAFIGEMDDELADLHYRECIGLATTLQVPAHMWPADRAAFEKYWQESLDEVHIDDAVRAFLHPIAAVRLRGLRLPWPLRGAFEEFALLMTTGFLPQRFRDEMGLRWGPQRQMLFDQVIALLRTGNNALPGFVRQFPFNLLLHELDWRIRTGRSLV
jgi:uncharacterized protein (DUF2236 family)